jgi:hypothetical protein
MDDAHNDGNDEKMNACMLQLMWLNGDGQLTGAASAMNVTNTRGGACFKKSRALILRHHCYVWSELARADVIQHLDCHAASIMLLCRGSVQE